MKKRAVFFEKLQYIYSNKFEVGEE